jgi:hypothetical protein
MYQKYLRGQTQDKISTIIKITLNNTIAGNVHFPGGGGIG